MAGGRGDRRSMPPALPLGLCQGALHVGTSVRVVVGGLGMHAQTVEGEGRVTEECWSIAALTARRERDCCTRLRLGVEWARRRKTS